MSPAAQNLKTLGGSLAFISGATILAGKDNATQRDDNLEWFGEYRAMNAQHFWIGDRWRWMRTKNPDELLGETTIEGQGEQLGRWVVESFVELANNPPPS